MKNDIDVISNWTIFSSHSVSIELHKFTDEEHNTEFYNSAITIFLDNGEPHEIQEKNEKVITITTNTWNHCENCCILSTLCHVAEMFDTIMDQVLIINDSGDIVDEVLLSDIT